MDDFQSLSHTKWECKYHVVFIPKCRRRTLYAQLRQHLGEVKKRDSSGAGVCGTETEFCWSAFLGARILCVHSGP